MTVTKISYWNLQNFENCKIKLQETSSQTLTSRTVSCGATSSSCLSPVRVFTFNFMLPNISNQIEILLKSSSKRF